MNGRDGRIELVAGGHISLACPFSALLVPLIFIGFIAGLGVSVGAFQTGDSSSWGWSAFAILVAVIVGRAYWRDVGFWW